METITILITPFWQGFAAGGLVVGVLAVVVVFALMKLSAKYQSKKSTFAENARMN